MCSGRKVPAEELRRHSRFVAAVALAEIVEGRAVDQVAAAWGVEATQVEPRRPKFQGPVRNGAIRVTWRVYLRGGLVKGVTKGQLQKLQQDAAKRAAQAALLCAAAGAPPPYRPPTDPLQTPSRPPPDPLFMSTAGGSTRT
eukprot:1193201-Prorocentrum_minimum.AAC.2